MTTLSRLFLSVCLVSCTAAVALAQPTVPTAVRDELAAIGSARVIVGVNLPSYELASNLTAEGIEAQESAIRQTVDSVLANLSGVTVGHRYQRIPFFSASVDADGLAALERSSGVTSIDEDNPELPTLTESVPLINAPAAWSAGATGAGWKVAVLDTGVQTSHPFFAGKTVAEACYSDSGGSGSGTSLCPGGAPSSTAPGSGVNCTVGQCFHGTFVAGIAMGAGGSFSGTAPGAQLISMKVFTQFNTVQVCGSQIPCVASYPSDQIAALDQLMVLAGPANVNQIAAANLSLSSGQYLTQASCDSQNVARKASIDNLRSIGIPTVISTGNSGYTNATGEPACISTAISVGSSTKADAMSSFTNRASFLSLLAPGSSINSSVLASAYGTYSGTSAAAPHVSGAWAVLKQGKPGASVTEILNALRATGVPVADGARVFPRINVNAARLALASGAPGQPTVSSASASGGTLTVTWTSGAGSPPTLHRVEFLSGGTPVAAIDTGAGTTIALPLPPGVAGTFQVRVTAGNGAGSSAPSPLFTFTIGGGAAPGMPTVTSATASGGVLTVAWMLGGGAAPTSHRLDFYQGAALVAQVPGGAANGAAIPIPAGVQGTFGVRVTAFNGALASPTSPPFTFTIGSACTMPANPVVTGSIVGGTANASWNAVSGATSYIVSAGATQGGSQYLPPTNIGNQLSIGTSGLPSGFSAWLRVIAVNGCGQQGAPTDFLLH